MFKELVYGNIMLALLKKVGIYRKITGLCLLDQ